MKKSRFLDLLEQTLKEVDNVGGGASADAQTGAAPNPNAVGDAVANAGRDVNAANKKYNDALRAALMQHPEFATASKDPAKLQGLIQNVLTPTTT